MESRHVSHFVAAYKRGSFASAAAALGLSQQAVSKSIGKLESNLGVRLFERDGRRLRATAYADLLLPHAQAIAAESERFRTGLDDMLGGRGGTLRIGVGPSAAVDLVAQASQRFALAHPRVRIRVHAGLYESMADDLVLGRLDLFVALRQVDGGKPLISEETIRDVRYLIVAGAQHELAAAATVSIAQLAGAEWIEGMALGDVDRQVEAMFAAAGCRRPPPAIETSSLLFALAVLARGSHLMVLPETLVAGGLASGELVEVRAPAEPWLRPLIVARRRNAARVRAVADFVEAMRT